MTAALADHIDAHIAKAHDLAPRVAAIPIDPAGDQTPVEGRVDVPKARVDAETVYRENLAVLEAKVNELDEAQQRILEEKLRVQGLMDEARVRNFHFEEPHGEHTNLGGDPRDHQISMLRRQLELERADAQKEN